jgi:hypothetical protein
MMRDRLVELINQIGLPFFLSRFGLFSLFAVRFSFLLFGLFSRYTGSGRFFMGFTPTLLIMKGKNVLLYS